MLVSHSEEPTLIPAIEPSPSPDRPGSSRNAHRADFQATDQSWEQWRTSSARTMITSDVLHHVVRGT